MVGTRWRHQGRQPGFGLDCIGVVVCVGEELGFQVFEPITIAYQRHAAADGFIRYFREFGKEIRLSQLHAGCVLAFREDKYPCHAGIVATDDHGATLIHAYALRRKVVEERLTLDWLSRVVGIFEYRGPQWQH